MEFIYQKNIRSPHLGQVKNGCLFTLFHSSFCFITFFNGFFGAGIAGEAIVDRNGKWPLALGARFLGVEVGTTVPEAHGTVSWGQAGAAFGVF